MKKVIIHFTKPENLQLAVKAAARLIDNPEIKDTALQWPDVGFTAFAVRNTKSISVWGSDRDET